MCIYMNTGENIDRAPALIDSPGPLRTHSVREGKLSSFGKPGCRIGIESLQERGFYYIMLAYGHESRKTRNGARETGQDQEEWAVGLCS